MSRGHDRERAVRKRLEEEGWWVTRAAGSLGDADIVALRAGQKPRLIEVKSTAAGPFHSFGPSDRSELVLAALKAGAKAELAYWPPYGELRFIPPSDWPQ